MYLYINIGNPNLGDLLIKAVGGANPPAAPSVSVPAPPAPPSAPTAGGGSSSGQGPKIPGMGGRQLVDCPLGNDCDKGGKHVAGSNTFKKHAKAAANKAKMALASARKEAKEKKKAAKEGSKVAATEEAGLKPAAEPTKPEKENLGGVGSDEAKKPEAASAAPRAARETLRGLGPPPAPTSFAQTAPEAAPAPTSFAQTAPESTAPKAESVLDRAKRREMQGRKLSRAEAEAVVINSPEMVEQRKEADIQLAKLAEESAERAKTQGIKGAKERGRQKFVQDVPVSEFEAKQGPLEHYRLSRVARESGDRETAARQEALARQKTQTLSSADHKALSEKLRVEGDAKNADYHSTIHNMVSGFMGRDEAMSTLDKLQRQADTDSATLEGYSEVEPSELRSEELATVGEEARAKFAEAKQKSEETAQQARVLRLKDKLKNVENVRDTSGSPGEAAAAGVVAERLNQQISDLEGEKPAEISQKMEREAAESAAEKTTQEAVATNVATKDRAKQTKLENRLSGAQSELETAKQSGDAKAVSQAENRVKRISENLEAHKKASAERAEGAAEPTVPPTQREETPAVEAAAAAEPATAAPREAEPAAAAPDDEITQASNTHAESGRNSIKEAEAAHEASKAEAAAVGARNASKLEEHNKAVSEWEAGGKKGKKPKKPKLETPPEISEKPKLTKPETDVEKLKHSTHQAEAAKQAAAIESHLRNNPSLSEEDKQRLKLAHKASVYNANIAHVPTAANRAEVSAAGAAAKQLGAHEHWDDVKAKQDAQITAAGATAEAKDQKEKAKVTAKEQKAKAKADAKEQAKQEKDRPKEIQNDLDRIKADGHKSKAQSLRERIQSHLDNNPDLTDSDREHGQRLLSELEEHENLGMVPGDDHSRRLRDVSANMGVYSKTYKEKREAGEGKGKDKEDMLSFLARRAKQGAAAGRGLAGAVISPQGAGRVGSQVVNYGLSGAAGAVHDLLTARKTDDKKTEETKQDESAQTMEDQQAEAAAQDAQQASEAARQDQAAAQATRTAIEAEAAQAGGRAPGIFKPRERAAASAAASPAPKSTPATSESAPSAAESATPEPAAPSAPRREPLKLSPEEAAGPGRRSLLRSMNHHTRGPALYIGLP